MRRSMMLLAAVLAPIAGAQAFTQVPVPEPDVLPLLGIGVVAAAIVAYRSRRRK
jgi:hypothetical protein